jgi:pathogenesis-related protein 1
MNRNLLVSLVVGLYAWSSCGAAFAQENTGSRVTVDEAKQLVELHNQARAAVKVGPVEWSRELAAYAQEWADELARSGKFEHRPGDGAFAQKYGENIAIGFGDGFGVHAAVGMWSAEKKAYVPGTPIPDDFATFAAGHYTQMVWRATTRVGAGRAVVQIGDRAGWTIIVCNYDPPGNVRGEKPY